jgi:hypothetical protein
MFCRETDESISPFSYTTFSVPHSGEILLKKDLYVLIRRHSQTQEMKKMLINCNKMWCTKRDLWTHLFLYRTSHPSILLGNKTIHYIPTVFKNFFLYNFPFLHTMQTLHTQQDFTHTRLTFSDLAIYIYLKHKK